MIRLPHLCIVIVAGALLAACGVKGDPQLPVDKADGYPRTYPDGAVAPEVRPENIFVGRR